MITNFFFNSESFVIKYSIPIFILEIYYKSVLNKSFYMKRKSNSLTINLLKSLSYIIY